MDVSGLGPGSLVGGRYRLVAEIGQDGPGRVWEAIDTQAGRRVAIRFEGGAPWTVMELVGQAPRTDTAVMPAVTSDYAAPYAPYDPATSAPPRRNSAIAGMVGAVILVVVAVLLGVTRPWHHSPDASAASVPDVPSSSALAGEVPTTPATVDSTPDSSTPSTTTTSSPSPAPTVSAPTSIVSNTLCLDASVSGGSVRSGAKVSSWTCHDGSNQKWQIHADRTIHSVADPSLCLDAAAPTGKVLDAAQVSAWSCHGGTNQQWVWKSDGSVSPVANPGLCLDAAGPIHSGSDVTAWPCNGGANEKWVAQ
jgi:hypothetical protein